MYAIFYTYARKAFKKKEIDPLIFFISVLIYKINLASLLPLFMIK